MVGVPWARVADDGERQGGAMRSYYYYTLRATPPPSPCEWLPPRTPISHRCRAMMGYRASLRYQELDVIRYEGVA